jgi:hypothetical protein
MAIDRTKNTTIIVNKEDIDSPDHPNLWSSWLDTLGIDPEATEICLRRSSLDHNRNDDRE